MRLAHTPPRRVHPIVQAGLRQADFVGYATNPHHKRGLPRGEAAALAAPLMNARLEPRAERLELCAQSLM